MPAQPEVCSNRSAALLSLAKTTKAVADAEECIRLRPDWDKGYFRKVSRGDTLQETGDHLHACTGWPPRVLASQHSSSFLPLV